MCKIDVFGSRQSKICFDEELQLPAVARVMRGIPVGANLTWVREIDNIRRT
jgi:hypothetical protein